MTTKLAIKHKDSFALKENKLLQEKKNQNYEQSNFKKYKHLSFFGLTLSIFLVYWFVLCPLIWAICDMPKTYWPSYWPFLFWTVALLIWIIIMCTLVIYWKKHLQARQNPEFNLITAKYGSDNVEKLLSIHQLSSENTNLFEIKNNPSGQKTKKDHGNFRRKDLRLVIHKQMSGENIDDVGIVHIEKDENDQLDIASDYVERNTFQDYLKLVAESPSENETKSPKPTMSPRELFFIDLIREAEKTDNAKSLQKIHSFPNETENDTKSEKEMNNGIDMTNKKDIEDIEDAKNDETIESMKSEKEINNGTDMTNKKDIEDAKNDETIESTKSEKEINNRTDMTNEKDMEDIEDAKNNETTDSTKSEKKINNGTDMTNEKVIEDVGNAKDDEKINRNESKRGSSYFIADVESSSNEKTEVFLQIDNELDEQLKINVEKPVVVLQPDKENL